MIIQGLYNIDEDIKINDIKEVKSPVIYKSNNVYNPEGLFSEEIFGQSATAREYTFGYIQLPVRIFNPHVAKNVIRRSGGIIKKLAYGNIRCDLEDGVLKQGDTGKYSGFKDLYNIWDQIDIAKNITSKSKDVLDLLTKLPKQVLFTDKIVVAPPSIREVGIKNGKMVKSELNDLYIKLLGLKKVTSHITSNPIQIYNKIQDTSIEIYDYTNNFTSGKHGFFQKQLLSKTTLWTARNVISAPMYDKEDSPIGVFRTGYPLATLCSLFNPIVKFHMKQFLSYNNLKEIHPRSEEVNSADIANIYDNKTIEDLLKIFMRNPGSRFKILYLDPEETKPIIFEATDLKTGEPISRPMTITDVVYMVCKSGIVDADRMVYTVRYPIGDHLGAFFTQAHILSTNNTTGVSFRGETMEYYPVIDISMSHQRVSIAFMNTVNMSNSRLVALGGDYDGDTVKSIGIWSDESNTRARALMYSKIYNIKPSGDTIYSIGIECLNGLYALTKTSSRK